MLGTYIRNMDTLIFNMDDWSLYVTEFAKRGLPHTSDFIHSKDCNFLLIHGMNLQFSYNVVLYFNLLFTKF